MKRPYIKYTATPSCGGCVPPQRPHAKTRVETCKKNVSTQTSASKCFAFSASLAPRAAFPDCQAAAIAAERLNLGSSS